MTLYQWRRARGLCVDCGEPSAGKARCTRHRAAVLDADRRRRALAAVGVVLAPRIEAAAKAGEGIRLDAAEVAALARPPRRKRKPKW